MAYLFWTGLAVAFLGLAWFAGWLMTKLKGGRTPMDTVDGHTIADRFWRNPL